MVQPATNLIARRVSLYEATAILFIICIIWVDEILDIPYVLLGGPATPINWRESLFESVIILIIGAVIIRHTHRLLMRVGQLPFRFVFVAAEHADAVFEQEGEHPGSRGEDDHLASADGVLPAGEFFMERVEPEPFGHAEGAQGARGLGLIGHGRGRGAGAGRSV